MQQNTNSKSSASRLRGALALPLLAPVLLYRKLISPFIAPRCRYYPTCSTYAVEALRSYGPLKGSILAAWRVVRCNPWSEGGFDHVEDQRLFRSHAHHHTAVCEEHHNHHGVAT